MFKYLGIDYNEEDRSRNPSNHYRKLIEKLRRRGNPLFLIIGRGEEYQFLCDSKRFRNRQGQNASRPTTADISHLAQFCDGELLLRVESALGIAVDCIKIDAECRHQGTELLGTRRLEALPSEVLAKMLYFHDCRRLSVQAGQKSRINELEATVNNMSTGEEVLRAENVRLLDGQRRAEQEAAIAKTDLEAEETLRQQAEASLERAEQEAATAKADLEAEETLRQQAEASLEGAVRQAERRLRNGYARQHDEWYQVIRNYRTDRVQHGPAFEGSVEAPGRASGAGRCWLNLRRETNQLRLDFENADDAQIRSEADLSRVRQELNHARRERDHLEGQLQRAQVYYPPVHTIPSLRNPPPNMGYHDHYYPAGLPPPRIAQPYQWPLLNGPPPTIGPPPNMGYYGPIGPPQLQGPPAYYGPRPPTPAPRSAHPDMGNHPQARRRG